MIITITSLRLRTLFKFFRLSLHGMKIMQQTKSQQGFVKMKNTGLGYMHYTLSAWETMDDIKNFSKSGAHLEAMKETTSIAKEIRIYTYESEKIPNWSEAKKLLGEKGKILKY